MQIIRNFAYDAFMRSIELGNLQASAALKGEHIGPGRRTLFTYWGGARRIRTRGRPAYNKSREKARRLLQMLRESARDEWRAHIAEVEGRGGIIPDEVKRVRLGELRKAAHAA